MSTTTDRVMTKTLGQVGRLVVHHDFECKDSKGRSIGAEIVTYEETFVVSIDDPEHYHYWAVEPGHYFCFDTHATRNGRWYGPVPGPLAKRRFATASERYAEIEKYLAAARKRAQKLALLPAPLTTVG